MEHSYLLGDRTLRFWIEGLIMIFFVILIVKAFLSDPYKPRMQFRYYIRDWVWHNKKDLIVGLLASLIAMRALEWAIHIGAKVFGIELPHTEDDFLYFIPIAGFIQYKLHQKFHLHHKDKH